MSITLDVCQGGERKDRHYQGPHLEQVWPAGESGLQGRCCNEPAVKANLQATCRQTGECGLQAAGRRERRQDSRHLPGAH